MATWNLVEKIDVHEERKPVLYDAKDKPLVRPVGFRVASKDKAAQ